MENKNENLKKRKHNSSESENLYLRTPHASGILGVDLVLSSAICVVRVSRAGGRPATIQHSITLKKITLILAQVGLASFGVGVWKIHVLGRG